MKYLLLAYADERRPASERDALAHACRINDGLLRERGHLIAVARLASGHIATTVRVQNGEICLVEGPFAEPKVQLDTLFFVEARDLNEAILVASNMPQVRHGFTIEVRPMLELTQH